ncbi:MAG: GNAT family N-acetyltransferase [Alphaproteobacteria bacterium]|nr:GNAT family N-acetyltransferase [Alphaproteobacteria bacterium]MBV8548507.1 GNAT family N-acetyltransferase [Alphaproteobacteria bacterium]
MFLINRWIKKPAHPYPRPRINTRLVGQRVIVRAVERSDWAEWRELREISRAFLTPWEPRWPNNALTHHYFSSLLRRYGREWQLANGYHFHIFLHPTDNGRKHARHAVGPLVGGVTLSALERGIAQKATLGYWMGHPYAGQGLMTEAGQLVIDFARDALRLHRLDACCLPHNDISCALLRRLGFAQEGLAASYLRIDGAWEDHLLWGMTLDSLAQSAAHSPAPLHPAG